MICSKCGHECADDVKFCTNCGVELAAEVQEEAVTEEVAEVVEEPVAVAEEVKAEVEEPVVAAEEVKAEVEEPVVAEAEQEDVAAAKEEAVADAAEVASEKKEKKSFKQLFAGMSGNVHKYIMMGASAVVLVLFLIFLIATLGSKDDSYVKASEKSVLAIEKRDGDLYAIYMDGEQVKLDDDKANSQVYSMDGSVVVYENEEEELVILKEGEIIATGIDKADGVVVSNGGDTIAYFTDCEKATYYVSEYDYEDTIKVGTLNLYDIKKKSSIEIAEEVVVDSAVLSPNGKTVAYVAEYEATDDFRGFYSVNGKEPVEVGKEKRVFAIADKAKYVYFMDVDRIYVMKKNDEEKLASDLNYVEVMMNADNTEMLFFMEDKTYITVKGGEKKKVANEEFTRVVLEDNAAKGGQDLDTEKGEISVTYTGVDTFEEKLFYCYYTDEIYYVKNKFEAEKLASGTYQYVLAEDGESLVYRNGSDVVKVTKFDKGGEKEVIASNAYPQKIYADGDLKHVYLLNSEFELYYVGKKGKGTKIADDVTSAVMSADGSYCYFIVEGEELCYSKNGGKEKELLVVEDGELYLTKENGVVYVGVSEDDVNTVYCMDGKKMKEVYSIEEETAYDDYIEDALDNLDDLMDYYD